MEIVKKIIDSYEELIVKKDGEIKDSQKDLSDLDVGLEGLRVAASAVASISDALTEINRLIDNKLRHREILVNRLDHRTEELAAIKTARNYFFDILRKHCEHDWVDDGYDYHNNCPDYICSFCRKVS